jgi:hypothetical protein
MQTAEFVELLAVPQAQAKNPLFDIIVEDKINIQNYCNALIAKILELKQSQFPAFIDYLQIPVILTTQFQFKVST